MHSFALRLLRFFILAVRRNRLPTVGSCGGCTSFVMIFSQPHDMLSILGLLPQWGHGSPFDGGLPFLIQLSLLLLCA